MENDEEKQYDLTYIVQDSEGYYRWTYEVDSHTNNSFLNMYLIIFALVILVPGLIMFYLVCIHNQYCNAGAYLGVLLLIFLGVEGLTYVIYKAIEKAKGGITDIPYLMGEDFIVVHPGNEWTPASYLQTNFSDLKDIKLDPDNDLILLNELMRVTHVYVPREDLPFVLNHIIDNMPKNEKTERFREKYGSVLKRVKYLN